MRSFKYNECLSVPAGKSHLSCAVFYCHFLPVWFYHALPHRLISTKILRKKETIEYKVHDSICCSTFVRNISHSKKKWPTYDHKFTSVFTKITRHSFQILIQIWIFSTGLKKILKISNSIKMCPVEPTCSLRTDTQTDGRTDRNDEADSRFFL